jgi:hypothetical protein
MKKILILICMVGLGFLLAWAVSDDSSQQKAELESLKAELQQLKTDIGKTEIERDTIKVRIALVEQNRDKLQVQVDELAGLRDRLQEQVDKLTFSRDQSRQQLAEIIGSRDKLKQQLAELTTSRSQLQKQVDELTRSRDTAVADAQIAQKRIEKLVALLDAETQKLSEPQDKLVVTNQAQEDTQTGMIEFSEYPAAPTEVSQPPVIPSRAVERPTCHSFNTTRPQILPGQTSTLSWQVSNADRIRIEPEVGPVSALGSMTVKPSATTTYTLIAVNRAGESRITRRVDVGEAPAVQRQTIKQPAVLSELVEPPVVGSKVSDLPTLHSFNTTRPVIMPGQTSTLSWQVSNADRIRIEPEVGPVSALGSRTVKPSATTTYTLIATNQAGDSKLLRKVEVSELITIFSSDSTRPQVLLEEYKASDDSKILSEQKTQVSDPNATLGKFLGYRARKDESGKFIFIPVFENKQEE